MLRLCLLSAALMLAALFPSRSNALKPREMPDTFLIPERAVIATGSPEHAGALVAILYDTRDLHFTDPSSPRFLFLDREGKVALGIGGYIKGTAQYDFDGAIDDGASFITYDIPVPANPAQKEQFYGNANHSTLFLQLVGRSPRFGYYQVYAQTQFTGGGKGGYGLTLKQAYLKVGYVTAGLANSTFVDASAGTPVIDDQGPSGEMSRKNVLVRYAPRFSDHISGGIGIEMPAVSMTTDASTAKINPRVPDLPLYVQYEWGGGNNHLRFSALWRNQSYRDLKTARNRFSTGWALQLSGLAHLTKNFAIYYEGACGRGYGSYLNDLSGNGMDLVYSSEEGKMKSPAMSNLEVGFRYDASSKVYFSGLYSEVRTYKLGYLGPDTYKSSRYVGASGYYKLASDLTIGLEYLWGHRKNYSGAGNHANRVIALLQYSF